MMTSQVYQNLGKWKMNVVHILRNTAFRYKGCIRGYSNDWQCFSTRIYHYFCDWEIIKGAMVIYELVTFYISKTKCIRPCLAFELRLQER